MDRFVTPFMRRLIILSFSLLYLLASCVKKEEAGPVRTYTFSPPPVPVVNQDTTNARSYLALGDSYTIGQAVQVADRFPVQTVKYLLQQGIKFSDPEIIAQTGWTTGNLLSSLDFSAPSKKGYDIVTLLIGVNNQYQRGTQQVYKEQLQLLVNRAIVYAGTIKKRVIVLSIPDYSVTQFAAGNDKVTIAREIDAFNEINKKIAEEADVTYLNITGASRLAAFDPSLIANDGLHPSGLQYKLWAELLVPVIRKVLQ